MRVRVQFAFEFEPFVRELHFFVLDDVSYAQEVEM